MNKASKKTTTAHKLGTFFAYFQDTVDQVVAFGFKKLEESGNKKSRKTDHSAKKALKKTAGFLGEMGATFYEKYEELKQKRNKSE